VGRVTEVTAEGERIMTNSIKIHKGDPLYQELMDDNSDLNRKTRQFREIIAARIFSERIERREYDNFMKHCAQFSEYENPCNSEDRGFGCF